MSLKKTQKRPHKLTPIKKKNQNNKPTNPETSQNKQIQSTYFFIQEPINLNGLVSQICITISLTAVCYLVPKITALRMRFAQNHDFEIIQ